MSSAILSEIPENALFVDSHEYAINEDGRVLVGISHYAVDCLGDVVYVDLPEVGDTLEKGDTFGSIESVKAASDLYMPVSGEIVAVNTRLTDEPELVNDDCYGSGWIIEIDTNNAEELDELMPPEAYAAMVDTADE